MWNPVKKKQPKAWCPMCELEGEGEPEYCDICAPIMEGFARSIAATEAAFPEGKRFGEIVAETFKED